MPYPTFLAFNGVPVPKVNTDSGGREADEVGGSTERTEAGGLRSTEQWRKGNWTYTAGPLSFAEAAPVLAQLGMGVVCTGTFNNGVAVTCHVQCVNRPQRKSWAGEVKQRLTFKLREA